MTRKACGILMLCLVVLTTLTTLHSFTPVKASAQIKLLHYYGFYTPPPTGLNGVFSVVGEIQNVGNVAANQVNVTVSFNNWQNISLKTSMSQTFIECLLPGQKAPFRLALSDSNAVNVKYYYITSISFNASTPKPLNLQILNSTFYTENGIMKSPGAVVNNGADSATNGEVIETYYNKTTGDILWASRAQVDSSNLTSGQTARFEVSSQPLSIIPEKCSYALVAESPQYLSPTFTVPFQDTIKPQFVDVRLFPNSPTPSQIVSVNATVTKPDYASKVSKVLLYYKVGGGQFKEINMTASGDVWRSPIAPKIGPFGAGQVIQYYIDAYDDAGNNATYPIHDFKVQGQPSGVPVEYVLIAFIVLILLIVIYKYRKRLF